MIYSQYYWNSLIILKIPYMTSVNMCELCKKYIGELEAMAAAVESAETAAASARAPFEWVDGPLVTAMREGDVFLLDELNLAEDSVLERINRQGCLSARKQGNHGSQLQR